MRRHCTECGTIYYGTPYCPSCQAPMGRVGDVIPAKTVKKKPGAQKKAPLATGLFSTVKRRFAALLIDEVILFAGTVIISMAAWFSFSIGTGQSSKGALPGGTFAAIAKLVYFLLWISYHTAFLGSTGQTPGKRFMGIRVTRTDGGRISYWRAFARTWGYVLSSFLYIGFLWAIWDRRKQAWHDKLADTVVVRV